MNDGSRIRHVGPAVVPRFETCGKRVKKTRFHPPLTVYFFSASPTRALSGIFVEVFSGPS